MYYVFSALTNGAQITAGIFVPNLLLGALWGRATGLFFQSVWSDSDSWARMDKYAFFGATAHLAGVVRLTFSLGVILMEASGVTTYCVPIFFLVLSSKLVGNMFTDSVYEQDLRLKGIPLLVKESPPQSLHITAKDFMSPGPVIVLPMTVTLEQVASVLRNTTHNGFPVVETPYGISEQELLDTQKYLKSRQLRVIKPAGQLRGLILRSQLLAIIKTDAHNRINGPMRTRNVVNEIRDLNRNSITPTYEEEILDGIENADEKIDLTLFMNPQPYTVKLETTLHHVHLIFAGLGLRHLMVINDSFEVVGIITRKDIAIFITEQLCCIPKLKVLEKRP